MIRIKNPNSSRLPNEYQEVEYIESSGTQYIDTGFIPNQDSSIEMVVKFNDLTINETLYCSRQSTSSSSLTCFKVASALRVDYATTKQTLSGFTLDATTKYVFYANKNQFYINGELKHTFTSATTTTPDTWALMVARNNGASYSNYGKYKLYSCRIWDNGTLIRNFVPCYRKSDNVVGLFDLVNNVFYTNAGTGVFLSGTEVSRRDVNIHPTPGGKTLLERYIENMLVYKNGPSYIDTEFTSSIMPTSWAKGEDYKHYYASNEYGIWNISSSTYDKTSSTVVYAFDDNLTTDFISATLNASTTDEIIEIVSPVPIKPKGIYFKYSIMGSDSKIQGYDEENKTWDDLHSLSKSGGSSVVDTVNVETDKFYTKFRVLMHRYSSTFKWVDMYEFKITSGTIRQEG